MVNATYFPPSFHFKEHCDDRSAVFQSVDATPRQASAGAKTLDGPASRPAVTVDERSIPMGRERKGEFP